MLPPPVSPLPSAIGEAERCCYCLARSACSYQALAGTNGRVPEIVLASSCTARCRTTTFSPRRAPSARAALCSSATGAGWTPIWPTLWQRPQVERYIAHSPRRRPPGGRRARQCGQAAGLPWRRGVGFASFGQPPPASSSVCFSHHTFSPAPLRPQNDAHLAALRAGLHPRRRGGCVGAHRAALYLCIRQGLTAHTCPPPLAAADAPPGDTRP